MKSAGQAESFEQILLSYVDMCYAVALALTRNPYDARDLTREVVTWAWLLRDRADCRRGIKRKLLAALRERFLQNCRHTTFTSRNEPVLAESV